jgi:ABC-2 type transport system ATP-binding protein
VSGDASAAWGADGVRVAFGARVAVDGVSLDAPPGRVTGVVGGDGAGKTTLLRALVGAVAVDAGTVRRPPSAALGYLPASSGTYPDLSVDENLQFTAAVYGLDRATAAARSAELVDRAGLGSARNRLAGALSGGMRQKLGVIRALLHRPHLVVLDEPTTGLDPVSRAEVWRLMAGAAADGAAVVVATTSVDEAARAAHLVVLDAGRTLAAGPPDEIVASVPGTVEIRSTRPSGDERRRSWRRAAEWREWSPPGTAPGGATDGPGTDLDLQDALTVLELRQELMTTGQAVTP